VLAVGGHGKWTVLVAKLKNAKQRCQGCVTDILVIMQVISTNLAWVSSYHNSHWKGFLKYSQHLLLKCKNNLAIGDLTSYLRLLRVNEKLQQIKNARPEASEW
jgi:hypothetical protein